MSNDIFCLDILEKLIFWTLILTELLISFCALKNHFYLNLTSVIFRRDREFRFSSFFPKNINIFLKIIAWNVFIQWEGQFYWLFFCFYAWWALLPGDIYEGESNGKLQGTEILLSAVRNIQCCNTKFIFSLSPSLSPSHFHTSVSW